MKQKINFTPNDIARIALKRAGKYSDVAYVQMIEELIVDLLKRTKNPIVSAKQLKNGDTSKI